MASVFGRAVLVAGAIVAIVGSATGAAARPLPPALVFSPSPYSYGQVAAGQTASQTFTLGNPGRSATGRLTVKLAGAAAFTITGDTCKSLPPGKRCAVTVRFAPAHVGAVTATLTAASKKHAAATDVLTGTGGVGGPAPSHLYWAAGDSIWEANLDGTNPQVIVTGQQDPAGVAVNTSHLYWTGSGDGTIWEANLDGTNPQAVVTGQNAPAGVAVDTSHLYWTGDGAIWEANLDGTNRRPSSPGSTMPGSGWPLTPATCTGPTPTAARSGRPTSTAPTRRPWSPGSFSRTGWQWAAPDRPHVLDQPRRRHGPQCRP